jgi:hypothetical protein
LIIAAWNNSGVGKVWPPMLDYQIAQETAPRAGSGGRMCKGTPGV